MKKIEGGVCAAKGFRAAGVHCGVKANSPADKNDLALIVSDTVAATAATFTSNRVKAAPIYVCMEHLENGLAQAIVANSGNANACAPEGMENAKRMAAAAAKAAGVDEDKVLVGSTGVIGQRLNVETIEAHMDEVASKLEASAAASQAANNAIMTTDTVEKTAAVAFTCGGKTCHIGGIAKGSGMIHPNMGTMLCFITTDCAIDPSLLRSALREVVSKTFNRISVDGDTSTNDTCIVMANGMAGNELLDWKSEEYHAFYNALYEVALTLAKKMAADGEGFPPDFLHGQAFPRRGVRRASGKGSHCIQLGQGGDVRRRCELGPCAVCHGLFQGTVPSGICQHWFLQRSGFHHRLRKRRSSRF